LIAVFLSSWKRAKMVRARDLLRGALETLETSGAAPPELKAELRMALAKLDAALGD
jgi:hypothetical protein